MFAIAPAGGSLAFRLMPVPVRDAAQRTDWLEGMLMLSKDETRELYRRRAKRYDLLSQLYRLSGFNINRYRQDTISALGLCPGDQVVELGCGTGLNFEYVQRIIGPEGSIVAVDLTDAMLDVARCRVAREHWTNVEIVQADLAEWQFPVGVSAVYSTLAITLVPEYDEIIKRASRALRPGGSLAVLDMKEPERWPTWLVNLAVWLYRPFGVSLDLAHRHPWESIGRYLRQTSYKEYYFGAIYVCAGRKEA
jgi:ubiquinone/menaquinone biosynthesis C-methylase UbiE